MGVVWLRVSMSAVLGLGALMPFTAQARKGKPASAATKAAEPKDLLDQQAIPKAFVGYAVHKTSGEVILWFQGTWMESPTVAGGGAGATWSRRAARLVPLDASGTGGILSTSFGLGRQDGRWVIRQFKLEPDYAQPGKFKPTTLADEGTGDFTDGVFRFEMDKLSIILFPGKEGWKPTSLRVFRFLGTDFTVSSTLVPCVAHAFGKGPTQLAPIWAAGSYLLLEDGPLGRMIYRGFGEQGNTWVLRYVREGGRVLRSTPDPYGGATRLEKGTYPVATLYQNGLGLAKSDFQGVESMSLDLAFKDPARLEEVRFDGKAWGTWNNPSMQFTLSGAASEMPLAEPVRAEALSRATEPQWLASGGPYSPQKLLNGAFQGCYAQVPFLSLNPAKSPGAQMGNEKNLQAQKLAIPGWMNAYQEAGVLTSKTVFTVKKPVPLGLILTPEQVEKLRSEHASPSKH